jgi:hypothetical protein
MSPPRHDFFALCAFKENVMAKYSKGAGKSVKRAMHKKKSGTLKSGSGRKVKSRKQAIAIGLSEAREKGAEVPKKRAKKTAKKTGRKAAKKGAGKASKRGRKATR